MYLQLWQTYQESSLRYSKSATLVLLLSSSSLTSVALIWKARKSPVSVTIEAAMPHQWPWRISGLLWCCIIIKQWALSWRGWTQINYLFLYSGDGYLLKRCLCHSSQLQGWDELHDCTKCCCAGMIWCCCCTCSSVLCSKREISWKVLATQLTTVQWGEGMLAQNVRENTEYFLEQHKMWGKVLSISWNSYTSQAKVLWYWQNYCSTSALAWQFHLEFAQQQDSLFWLHHHGGASGGNKLIAKAPNMDLSKIPRNRLSRLTVDCKKLAILHSLLR